MTDDPNRERMLVEDGLPRGEELDAWTVPRPHADFDDRIMDALEPDLDALERRTNQAVEQENMPMHATITESPSRATIVPIVIGIATAAAILAAFWVGRSSVGAPEPVERVVAETAVVAPAAPAPAPAIAPTPAVPEQVRVRFEVQPADTEIFVYDGTRERSVAAGESIDLFRLADDSDYMVTMATADGSISRVSLRLGTAPTQTFLADLRPTPALEVREGTAAPRDSRPQGASPPSRDLKDPFAKTSTFRIGTNPGVPPADVYVDGRPVGRTPIPGLKVTPGRHEVRFRWPGGKEIRQRVTVDPGGAKVVKAG